jgi:phosphonate transport system substrate-binding protein
MGSDQIGGSAGLAGARWRVSISRRTFIGTGAAFVAARFSGVSRADQSVTLRFGLTPVFLSDDLELLANLKAYLDNSTGFSVQLVTRRTYQEITTLLISGQLDAAWICGYPFVQYRHELDLVAVPVWRGEPLYQSYLIADSHREASGIDDLNGDIHAFSDPDSNSGFLVTRALLAERRVQPEAFFRHFFFTYGHRNVIRAVGAGLAQSGSVDGYVWEVMSEVEPALTGRTRIVRKSEKLGFPPIAAPRALRGTAAVTALTAALLHMPNHPTGRAMLRMLRLDGFTRSEPSLFDTIAAKVELVRKYG